MVGAPLDDTSVVDQLLELMLSARALVPVTPARARARSRPGTRLLLAISGAIASALTPALVSLLQRRGFELRVIATPTALRRDTLDADMLALLEAEAPAPRSTTRASATARIAPSSSRPST